MGAGGRIRAVVGVQRYLHLGRAVVGEHTVDSECAVDLQGSVIGEGCPVRNGEGRVLQDGQGLAIGYFKILLQGLVSVYLSAVSFKNHTAPFFLFTLIADRGHRNKRTSIRTRGKSSVGFRIPRSADARTCAI